MLDILVVDDEPATLEFVGTVLRDHGHQVTCATDGAQAMACIDARVYDVVISDIHLPKVDGFTIFRRLRKEAPTTRVILITAYGSIDDAVTAMKEKADDYLTKPFDLGELAEVVDHIALRKQLEGERRHARAHLSRLGPQAVMVGQSPAMANLHQQVDAIASSDRAVLITGESGTGKDLIARAIHHRSPRRERPFVAVNCAAFPETMLEEELFGHERGAFTGALRRREGRFQAAHGGTLFLDEIGEMPLAAQAKLLRVLQEGSFEPLGTSTSSKVDVRVLSATNRDIKKLMVSGLFREDLFYRIKVFHLQVPPLRERRTDLTVLVEHFHQQLRGAESEPPSISPRAWSAICHYPFPGNVRELAHAIEHAVVLAQGKEIDLAHLPEEIRGDAPRLEGCSEGLRPLAAAVKEFERDYLQRALDLTHGNKTRAAEMLGISRKSLWEKLKAHRLEARLLS